jgi:glycosyltransferase involved in cell wall biosynthesis
LILSSYYKIKECHQKPPGVLLVTTIQIVGIVLIKNEDIHIERAIRNVVNFCDLIIVADHQSQDHTFEIVENLAKEFPHIQLKKIDHPRESHQVIEQFAGTPTWIFVVDGDEIYDPAGLAIMRRYLQEGRFDQDWNIFCNTLNCVALDYTKKTARGYLAPPSRAGARLFNFSLIESWTGCPERVHGGNIIFKPGYHLGLRHYLHTEYSWENAFFRCVHVAFVQRSSLQRPFVGKGRLNPGEIEERNISKNWRHFPGYLKILIKYWIGIDWKSQKYRRGGLVEKNISAFLP